MSNSWLAFLAASGANLDQGVARDFGDPAGEIAATARGDVLADLSHLCILSIHGADAESFLHSQLSCDVVGLPEARATYGCYCTAKGRVLANFLLWREPDGFRMLVPRSILPAIEKRLRMFLLRAKAVLTDRSSEDVVLGLAGPTVTVPSGLRSVLNASAMPSTLEIARRSPVTIIGLPGSRLILVLPARQASEIWPQLAPNFKPVGSVCWEWLDIVNGLAWIRGATQDQFVPQMANFELIGAVNFQKGCYPGQEIVARTQYLGKPKRRLQLAHVDTNLAPSEGERLVTAGGEKDSPAGTVVNVARSPEGGFDLLAVVHTASVNGATVRLGSHDGPPLAFRPLPYSV